MPNIRILMTCLRAIVLGVAFLGILIAGPAESAQWPLGPWGDRSLQRVELPGVTCGNGTPFALFYSAAPDPNERRATIYFQGGGSTKCNVDDATCPSANVDTSMRNLAGLTRRLNAPTSSSAVERVFMDHPDNDAFMGPSHWLVIPYCTQDMHVGGRSDIQTYDMTHVSDYDPNHTLVAEVESLLNDGSSVADIEATYPGLEIASVTGSPGNLQVDSLLVHVVHRGDANVRAALQWVNERVTQNAPDFFDTAQLMVTGGSAGGLGALHQFWRFGDLLDGSAQTSLTLAPLAGGSIENWYSEPDGGLVFQEPLAEEIDRQWEFWQGQRPCEVAGGAHTPSAENECDDIVDLLEHYRVQRYPGRDILYMPMVNKEDYVALNILFGTDPETVVGFARTVHRYFQNLARLPSVFPYATWTTYQENGGAQQREHTPDRATILMPIQRPSGVSEPSPHSMLRYMNLLASRSLTDETPQIEYVPVIVHEINDPESSFTLETDRFSYPAGNVARPVGLSARKLEMRSDVKPPISDRKRSLKFTASTRRAPGVDRIVVPSPESDGDPSLHGARLVVRNTSSTSESFVIDLPAPGWTAMGSTSAPSGWQWRSRDPAYGVSSIKVKANKLTIRAGKEGFGYTLDEASQGSIGLRLELGHAWLLCADTPARTRGVPPSSAKFDLPGRFTGASDALAPTRCPLRPVP